jgi:hypothetical protein
MKVNIYSHIICSYGGGECGQKYFLLTKPRKLIE